MRKVFLSLIGLGLLLGCMFSNVYATPSFDYYALYSDRRVYDPNTFSLPETHPGYNGTAYWFMQAQAFVSGDPGETYPVIFDSTVTEQYEMKYWGERSDFGFDTFSYNVGTFLNLSDPYWGGPYPTPGEAWEDNHYTFSVGGVSVSLDIPYNSIKELDTPVAVISGSVHPTISWTTVEGAAYYTVGIYGVREDGYIDWPDNKFWESPIMNQTSFTYTGDLFADGTEYCVMVQARDWVSSYSTHFNRSDFVTKHSAPVPEPTTMLLLGSGLIGLVGFRRKFKKS
jgi:PEP-CTERM motif-containing protein